MKVRTGFVSNSSGSSFILVHLPDDFDFDVQKLAIIEIYKKRHTKELEINPRARLYIPEEINMITEADINELKRRGHIYEYDSPDKFWMLYEFLKEFSLLHVEVQEESGWIKLANKDFFKKASEIDLKVQNDNEKYKEEVKEKKERRKLLQQKMKQVDPYEEEDWEDEL